MIEINNYKLNPTAIWGEIHGDITKQTDLQILLGDYLKSDELDNELNEFGNSLKIWVENKNYLTEHQDLSSYATKTWVESKNYLTQHQSLTDYAKKTDIPSLTGYAKESWVESKNYLTEHQSLTDYAKKTDIPSLTGYAKESWVESKNYLTQHQPLKTINGQKITGYGDIEIQGGGGGSFSPEINDVFNNPSSGVVVYDNIQSGKETRLQLVPEMSNNMWCDINGEYYAYSDHLYKLNPDTLEVTQIGTDTYAGGQYPLWKDNSGRVYLAGMAEIDLNTGNIGNWINQFFIMHNQGRLNIVYGKNGIYCYDAMARTGYKFNEGLQQFETFNFNLDNVNLNDPFSWFLDIFYWDGECWLLTEGQTYKLFEDDERTWFDPVMPFHDQALYLQNGRNIYVMSDRMFYLPSAQEAYKLSDNHFEPYTISGIDYNEGPASGKVIGELILGAFEDSKNDSIINLGHDIVKVGWTELKKLSLPNYINKTSYESIQGFKQFDGGVGFNYCSLWNGNISFGGENCNIQTQPGLKLKINDVPMIWAEMPEDDGEYVLKAIKTGEDLTYKWIKVWTGTEDDWNQLSDMDKEKYAISLIK